MAVDALVTALTDSHEVLCAVAPTLTDRLTMMGVQFSIAVPTTLTTTVLTLVVIPPVDALSSLIPVVGVLTHSHIST